MLSPNTVLQNRYRIVRQLGRGGMGAVYEAIDQRLSRTVALKETLVDSDELRRAFEHEARLLANLRHPALPKVIDHFTEGDGQYLVMEFIPGDDLAQQLEKRGRAFDAQDVMRWTDELLDALDYLHTHDPPIIHRDIKPHNLKQTAQGRIVLLDFGLAKGAAGEMTRVASGVSILGYTPHYASLEQIQGEKTNARSDLYSMAATLYNLLTNRVPTDALKRATELINDEADPLPRVTSLNPNVPDALDRVLTGALALRPSDRPSSANAMRAALHNPSLISDNHDEVTRLRPPDFVAAKALPVTRRDGLNDVRPAIIGVNNPQLASGNRKKVWIISSIASLVIALAALGAYFAFRPHDLTSTVAPTNVPAEGIPSPFNSEIVSLGALTIQDADGRIVRQGTGVFVRPDEVATSLSVIEGGARGRVAMVGQSGSFEIGNVTGFDPVHHLVTLKVNGAKAPPLSAGANQRTTISDKVASLGTAAKYREASFFEASFAQGSITGYRDDDLMEVKLNGGLSPGAPLLNDRGELIGILSSVSGGNANQALAIPVVYVAQTLSKRVTGMSLAVAAAKDPFFDFRESVPEIKEPSKALESKVIQTVRDIHNKAKAPSPPKNDNTEASSPVQEPTPVEIPDEMANAVVTGMVEGAFTAPGAKQQAFLIDTKSGSSADNYGPKYLVIFNGDNYVTDLPVKDHSLILITSDLNRDGINELLLGYKYIQMGVMLDGAQLIDINKGKIRVTRDFGTVYQGNCGADEKSGTISASAIFAGAAATGQFPDFRVDNFDAPCGTQGKNSPNWKYVSTGKMQQKY